MLSLHPPHTPRLTPQTYFKHKTEKGATTLRNTIASPNVSQQQLAAAQRSPSAAALPRRGAAPALILQPLLQTVRAKCQHHITQYTA